MILYHGSKAKFEKFDLKKIGSENGTSEGKGFYFTNNKQIASGYAENGYLYTIQFKGKKSLSETSLNITKEEYKQLAKKLHDLDGYLYNYGDVDSDGLENVLNEACKMCFEYSDNDSDFISEITNSSGSTRLVLELLYEMFGYDHIMIEKADWGNQTIVVALTPDCFEIVSIEEMKKTETV